MTDNLEPVVKITLTRIYDKLLDVDEKVKKVQGVVEDVSDHEVRIRAIEKYLWIWIGASGVLGAGASQLVSFILNR